MGAYFSPYLKLSSRFSNVPRKDDLIYKGFLPPLISHNRNENICLKYPFLGYFPLFLLFLLPLVFCFQPTRFNLYPVFNKDSAFCSFFTLFWWLFSIISVLSHCLRRANLIFSNFKFARCACVKFSHVVKQYSFLFCGSEMLFLTSSLSVSKPKYR